MILVIGGRSKIGSALIGELVAKGRAVRAVVRSGEGAGSLPAGVEALTGDLADRDSLRSSLTGAEYPPMGVRFRLKAGYDLSGFSPEARVILRALQTYGMILADNGSPWYISGVPDERWDNDVLHELHRVRGQDFEAVDVSSLRVDSDSGQAR